MRPERGALSGGALASIRPMTLAADQVFPAPGCHSPERERRELAVTNAVPKTNSIHDRSAISSYMTALIASHGRRWIHSSIDAKGRTTAVPTCASHRGALA